MRFGQQGHKAFGRRLQLLRQRLVALGHDLKQPLLDLRGYARTCWRSGVGKDDNPHPVLRKHAQRCRVLQGGTAVGNAHCAGFVGTDCPVRTKDLRRRAATKCTLRLAERLTFDRPPLRRIARWPGSQLPAEEAHHIGSARIEATHGFCRTERPVLLGDQAIIASYVACGEVFNGHILPCKGRLVHAKGTQQSVSDGIAVGLASDPGNGQTCDGDRQVGIVRIGPRREEQRGVLKGSAKVLLCGGHIGLTVVIELSNPRES